MNRAAVDNAMITNSLGSSFSASFKFRGSLEGGLDGLDFSDNLDLLDEHMLDDIFPEDGQGNHDDSFRDSFRDSFMATFSIPTEHSSGLGSSAKATGDAIMSNADSDHFQIELMGMATTHSGASSMMSGGAAAAAWPRPRFRQSLETTEEITPEPVRGPPRRRCTTNSVPERRAHGENPTHGSDGFGHQGNRRLPARHILRGNSDSKLLHSENPSRKKFQFNEVDFGNEPLAADNLVVHEEHPIGYGHQGNRRLPARHISRGNSDSKLLHSENPSRKKFQFNEVDFGNEPLAADNLVVHEEHPIGYGHQGNRRLPARHISRGNSDSMLLDSENPSRGKFQFNEVDFGNEPLAADNLAVHEAQDKMFRLKGMLGHEQQGLVSDVIGGNNHPHAHGQMSFQTAPPAAPSFNGPMRRTSEHGLPWTPPCPQNDQQMQVTMQQVTMAKLQAAMERTSSTMKLLQDWDRAHGLPASHCQTMVNTSRSRKQLKEGVVLKKWNGVPLLNESR